MRQWMVDPKIMCRKHLLGEHVEHHMFVGSINKGTSMAGYLKAGQLEPAALQSRHDELVAEMLRRGYNHNTPLQPTVPEFEKAEYFGTLINREASLVELLRRCPECRALYEERAK